MLKKLIGRSLIITAVIIAVCTVANLIKYRLTGDIFGKTFYGGDIVEKKMLGLAYSHYYPETSIDAPYTGPVTVLGLDIADFVVGFAVIFAAVLLISAAISLLSRKKAK